MKLSEGIILLFYNFTKNVYFMSTAQQKKCFMLSPNTCHSLHHLKPFCWVVFFVLFSLEGEVLDNHNILRTLLFFLKVVFWDDLLLLCLQVIRPYARLIDLPELEHVIFSLTTLLSHAHSFERHELSHLFLENGVYYERLICRCIRLCLLQELEACRKVLALCLKEAVALLDEHLGNINVVVFNAIHVAVQHEKT